MKKIYLILSLAVLSVLSAFGAGDGYRRTWDFTKGWSATTLEIMAQDTELWTVQGTGFQNTGKASDLTAKMNYNGEQIPVPELEGLELGAMKNSAHVQIYDGFTKNSSFPDLACLWINGNKNYDYVSFKVPAGENVKIGYCSHSNSQARGFKVSSGFADAEGNTQFTSKADATVVEVELINSNTEESTLKLSSTSGHHIYYIIIGAGDEAESYTAGYLYSGATAMEDLPLYGMLKNVENLTFKGINIDNGLPVKDSLMALDAVVLDGSLSADNAELVSFLKENIYWQPVFNVNGKLAEALGFGSVVTPEAPIAWVLEPKDAVFEGFEGAYYGDSLKCILSETASCPMVVTGQKNIKKYVSLCGFEDYTVYSDSLLAYVYNAGHNQYTYYGVGEEYAGSTEVLVKNLFVQTLASKTEVSETPKPAFTGDYKEMESVISISCLNKNATIYYTIDGTEPVVGVSPVYTEPISVTTEGVTIKALAITDGYLVSEVNSIDVLLYHQAKMPVINCTGNGLAENAVITLEAEAELVDIYYNFTGSEKINESSLYDGPITLPVSATIYAFAVSDTLGLVQSELASQQVFANVEKIRRDELAHFKVNGAGWNTLENLTLDGEQMVAWTNSNYYFSWGKTAAKSYEEGDAVVDENGDPVVDETGNFVYEKTPKAYSVTTNSADPDWQLVSCGQVMIYQGNTLGANIGDGGGYNPERAEDYLEKLGTTGDIQFGGVESGDIYTGSIQSTKKFAGPFNVVAIIANVGSGGRLAVEVSADSATWTQVGDTLQTSTVKRLYKKFEVSYEGTDEVYVRLASIKGSSQAVHDIYVFNQGEKSAAMKEELAAGIEEVVVAPETVVAVRPVKKVIDGKLVIVVGDAVYSVTGARLK